MTELPAESCSHCGQANPDKLSICAACGSTLTEEPPPTSTEPARKSKTVAVLLALIFGPLGLLYVGAWWLAFVMIMINVPFLLTGKGGLWISLGGRIIAAAMAYNLAVEQDDAPNSERDAERLLDKAARLENVAFPEAIAVYEEVIREYPDTRASRQATSAIETLKRSA